MLFQAACTLPLLAAITMNHFLISRGSGSADTSECSLPGSEDSQLNASSLLQTQRTSSRENNEGEGLEGEQEQWQWVWQKTSASKGEKEKQDEENRRKLITKEYEARRAELAKQEQSELGKFPVNLGVKDEQSAPCACEADSAAWLPPAPRPPRCIFIDLGAADGNTFARFLDNGYGDVKNCPSGGSYHAILVEANPIFTKALQKVQGNNPDTVRTLSAAAAYMCEGTTSFYLDTVDVQQNFWGSSMSPNARDVQRSGKKQVKVPLVNVARLIVESCLPEDYVLVKMDIEGSEHDIVPCLTQSPRALGLIDALYVEKHPEQWSLAGVEPGTLDRSLALIKDKGVTVPEYDTSMLQTGQTVTQVK